MKWRVIWTPRAEKDLETLDRIAGRRIRHTLDRFSETGHADVTRIINVGPPTWRIRVGNHRVIVDLLDDRGEAHILRIHRRDSAY